MSRSHLWNALLLFLVLITASVETAVRAVVLESSTGPVTLDGATVVGESVTCAPGAVIDYFLLDGNVTDMVISFEGCTFTRGLHIGSSDVVLSNSRVTLTDLIVPTGRFAVLAGAITNCSVLISGGRFSYTVPVTAALLQSVDLVLVERNATVAVYTRTVDGFTVEVRGVSITSSLVAGFAVVVRRDAARMNVTLTGTTVTADAAVYGISVSTNDDLGVNSTALTTWGDFRAVDSTVTIVKSLFGVFANMTAVRLSSNRFGPAFILLENVACTVTGSVDISLSGFVIYSPYVTYVDAVNVTDSTFSVTRGGLVGAITVSTTATVRSFFVARNNIAVTSFALAVAIGIAGPDQTVYPGTRQNCIFVDNAISASGTGSVYGMTFSFDAAADVGSYVITSTLPATAFLLESTGPVPASVPLDPSAMASLPALAAAITFASTAGDSPGKLSTADAIIVDVSASIKSAGRAYAVNLRQPDAVIGSISVRGSDVTVTCDADETCRGLRFGTAFTAAAVIGPLRLAVVYTAATATITAPAVIALEAAGGAVGDLTLRSATLSLTASAAFVQPTAPAASAAPRATHLKFSVSTAAVLANITGARLDMDDVVMVLRLQLPAASDAAMTVPVILGLAQPAFVSRLGFGEASVTGAEIDLDHWNATATSTVTNTEVASVPLFAGPGTTKDSATGASSLVGNCVRMNGADVGPVTLRSLLSAFLPEGDEWYTACNAATPAANTTTSSPAMLNTTTNATASSSVPPTALPSTTTAAPPTATPSPPLPLGGDAGKVERATGAASAAAFAVSSSVVGAAAIGVGRTLAVASMLRGLSLTGADCRGMDPQDPPDFVDSPLALTLGSPVDYVAGTAVGAPIVVVIFGVGSAALSLLTSLVCAAVCWVLERLRSRRQGDSPGAPPVRRRIGSVVAASRGRAVEACVTGALFAAATLTPGAISTAIVRVAWGPVTGRDGGATAGAVVGAIAVAGVLLGAGAAAACNAGASVIQYDATEQQPESGTQQAPTTEPLAVAKPDAADTETSTAGPAPGALARVRAFFVAPRGEWAPREEDNHASAASKWLAPSVLLPCVDDYVGHRAWFAAVEALTQVVLAIAAAASEFFPLPEVEGLAEAEANSTASSLSSLSSASAADDGLGIKSCAAVGWSTVAVLGLYLVALVVARPHRYRLLYYTALVPNAVIFVLTVATSAILQRAIIRGVFTFGDAEAIAALAVALQVVALLQTLYALIVQLLDFIIAVRSRDALAFARRARCFALATARTAAHEDSMSKKFSHPMTSAAAAAGRMNRHFAEPWELDAMGSTLTAASQERPSRLSTGRRSQRVDDDDEQAALEERLRTLLL